MCGSMKVLHICKRDSGGGAPTACERLHRALLAQSVDSWILCDVPSGAVPNVVGMRQGNGRGRFLDRLLARFRFELSRFIRPPFFYEPFCHGYANSLNVTRNRLLGRIEDLQPDIVHLHWVSSGFLRIEDLPRIAAKYPVVWTLHDMWAFGGAEHVAYADVRWKTGYTTENRDPAAKGPDWNRWVWNRKRKAWAGLTIHTIGVSRWMDESVKASRLFQEIPGFRRMIHNGLDESVFHPAAVSSRPELIDSESNKRPWHILFGAASQKDQTKGGGFLLQALQILLERGHDMKLVTFGTGGVPGEIGVPVENRGKISEPSELAKLYASADVVVVPSRLESFGQVAAEALACGTPVVCFDTSGLQDIVDHKKNGYRARCDDATDLAEGIRWCLEDTERHVALRQAACKAANDRFRIDDIAVKNIHFYKEILQDSGVPNNP